ncbi:MAG TPA: murein biosynthesis integral membrane protein MurJ [Thermoleophilaceae bacterium]
MTGRSETAAQRRGRLALSTIFFSAATGVSRVVGLIREVVAANYFGVLGPMSSFTIAFQVPNLVRALFADAALQGAFVPVFTELLEQGRKREAIHVASSLFFLITLVLGAITAGFILAAGVVMPIFTPGFSDHLTDLTVSLSRILFPIVLLMALTGLMAGMLNSLEHFSVPALAPVAWNIVIIVFLTALRPDFGGDQHINAYAWGVLAGTIVQFLMPIPWLRRYGVPIKPRLDWRNEHVRRVFKLMLPVTIALGVINFDNVINSIFGTLVSKEAPAAIDRAFRIYMLPQGIFSVAIATILFPTLSRFATHEDFEGLRKTMANGVRLIAMLLIPSAVLMMVLAQPITRLIYQRGVFDAEATDLVTQAMVFWSLSLPAQGISLLFSRTFFSLQRPWITTGISVANMLVNVGFSAALYKPFGIAGIVLGSVAGTLTMALLQGRYLSKLLRGIEGRRTLAAMLKMIGAATVLAGVSYVVWYGLDKALGRSLPAQAVSLGIGIGAGIAVYVGAVVALRIEEAEQIRRLIAGRFGRRD